MPNGGRSSPICNLRESTAARRQLDVLASKDRRFQAIWNGLMWLVLRDPACGTPVPGLPMSYILKTTDFLAIGLPVMGVFYKRDGDLVEVIEVYEV